jgi:phosphoribosylformylglycinamidine synthase
MRVRVTVTPRPEILDPQGRAVEHALASLGFAGVRQVRVGRVVDLDVADGVTGADVERMAAELLANPIVEDFRVDVL